MSAMARLHLRGAAAWLPALPALALLVTFFVVPYLFMGRQSLTDPDTGRLSTATFREVLADPFHWEVLFHTVRLALLSTVLCVILGFPLAYLLSRLRGRARTLMLLLVIAPLLVGVIVRSFGWLVLLDDGGLVNTALDAVNLGPVQFIGTDLAIVIGFVHIYLPFMVLPLGSALENLDSDTEVAARSLGAGPWATFWHVTVPASIPGLRSGCVLVFVLSVSAYVIPSLLGAFRVLTMPVLIVQQLTVRGNWEEGTALSLMFFATVAVVVVGMLTVLRRPRGSS
jgi:putative spermidine/putrescine transport system permease protein